MTNESTMSQSERTFSQTEVVSDNTEMEVCILVLFENALENIESSVEAVIESDLVNAPVSPVLK